MKVILKQDVKGQGKKGELVSVSDGYARNFLFPRNLAAVADAAAMNELKNKEAAARFHADQEKKAARELAERLTDTAVVLHAKAGSTGRLFGAVTSRELAEAMREQFGYEVDKRKIVMADIKNYGEHQAEIKLNAGITAKFRIIVQE